MKKIGIFYGSTTGTTAAVAQKIATALGVGGEDVHNVADTAPSAVAPYDVLILGASTWGSGDLQDDMTDFVTGLEELSLRGKDLALFGCGDESMSDTFCNGVGEMHERLCKTGAKTIGAFNTDGYTFSRSKAAPDGAAVGLLLDEMNRPELTEPRIAAWAAELRKEL